MTEHHEVIIVGAGPAGLMLACELRLAGARPVVLERLTDIDPTVRAGSINTPTASAFDRRGLLPELTEAQNGNLAKFAEFARSRPEGLEKPPRFAGHFAGIPLRMDNFDESDPELAGFGPAGEIGMVTQQQVETILGRRTAELGVPVRRGVTVTAIDLAEDGVTVHCGDESLTADWLVGCDGGRSLVRRTAGFAFPGTGPELTCYQAMVDMTGAERLVGGWTDTPTGIYAHGPFPGRLLLVDPSGPPADRDAPITVAELQDAARRVTGVDLTIDAIRTATRFTDNARQVDDYRRGRVLLAGDAAHVHSPFGGQGLNLGIGDAVGLGWRLAAVVAGADEALLDDYTVERHPIAGWVLDWSRAQVALMRTDPRSRAMREVTERLLDTVHGTTYVTKRISGVWQRHELPGDHPWIGRGAPELEFTDGSRTADHLHDGGWRLFDLSGGERPVECPVPVVAVECRDDTAPSAFLVRPDGVVAWTVDCGLKLGDVRGVPNRDQSNIVNA